MPAFDLLQRVGVAAAIGLLIGIERGWQLRDQKDGARVAGIRTFSLIGLGGGISGLLASLTAPVVLGLSVFGFAIGFGLLERQHMRRTGIFSATGFVAALLTFLLGAAALQGDLIIAAAGGVLTAIVLAQRHAMHGFLRHLRWLELRAGLLLLVMTVVLLPVLPDRFVDHWEAINPYRIWLMTVLLAVVSFAGYVAMRLAGARRGLLYAGLAGGLISSTTVTWVYSRMVRKDRNMRAGVLAAILSSWTVSLLRMGGIAIAVAPGLAGQLMAPLLAASVLLAAPAAISYALAGNRAASDRKLPLKNPFELTTVLGFGLLLTVIMLLSRLAAAWSGEKGLSILSAASGLLDVDPITLSMAQAAQAGMTASHAAAIILIAALANGTAKTFLGCIFGGWRVGVILAIAMLTAAGAAAAAFYL